jgi:hypothetical protein
MATKRPENPYDGFISALFKDASEAIKDTAKKLPPEGAAKDPESATPGITPSITPDITPDIEKQVKPDTVSRLERQAGIQSEDQAEGVTQDRVMLRTLELVLDREHPPPDDKTNADVSLLTDGGDGSSDEEKPTRDHAEDHTEYQTKDHTRYHTPSGFEVYPLTEFQRKVLIFLVEKEKKVTAMREIAACTGVSYNTIRKILRVLFSNGLIVRDKEKFISGKFQGFSYTVKEAACKKALEGHTGYHTGYQTEDQTEGQTTRGNSATCEIRDASAVVQQLVAHFQEIYPNLHALGLRRKDIVEVVQCWKTQNYDVAKLTDSFEAADWDLAHNDDGHIQIPATYVRKALKSGPYSFPKGFKSRRRIQAEQEAQLAEDCRKFLEKTIEDCFYIWWTGMAPADKQKTDAEIARTNKIMPNLSDVQKNILRQEWFRENVYCEEIKKKLLTTSKSA